MSDLIQRGTCYLVLQDHPNGLWKSRDILQILEVDTTQVTLVVSRKPTSMRMGTAGFKFWVENGSIALIREPEAHSGVR